MSKSICRGVFCALTLVLLSFTGSLKAQSGVFTAYPSKSYGPSAWQRADTAFEFLHRLYVPDTVWVEQGNAGNHKLYVHLKNAAGQWDTLTYVGGASVSQPSNPTQTALGAFWKFQSATGGLLPGGYGNVRELRAEVNGASNFGTTLAKLSFGKLFDLRPYTGYISADTLRLQSSKYYSDSRWKIGIYTGPAVDLILPASIKVLAGNAGNHNLTFRLGLVSGDTLTFTYRGGASVSQPSNGTQLALGEFWNFLSGSGAAPGDTLAVNYLHLEINGASSLGTTTAEARLPLFIHRPHIGGDSLITGCDSVALAPEEVLPGYIYSWYHGPYTGTLSYNVHLGNYVTTLSCATKGALAHVQAGDYIWIHAGTTLEYAGLAPGKYLVLAANPVEALGQVFYELAMIETVPGFEPITPGEEAGISFSVGRSGGSYMARHEGRHRLMTERYGVTAISDSVEVMIGSMPQVSAGEDRWIYYGDPTVLEAVRLDSITCGVHYIAPGGTWAWTPATGLQTPNERITVAEPIISTYYVASLTDALGCGTAYDTVHVEVIVKDTTLPIYRVGDTLFLASFKDYEPVPYFGVGRGVLDSSFVFEIPAYFEVDSGNAGNHELTFSYGHTADQKTVLVYRGGSSQSNPQSPEEIALGQRYVFSHSVPAGREPGMQAGGRFFEFRINNGDKWSGITVVREQLLAGNGIFNFHKKETPGDFTSCDDSARFSINLEVINDQYTVDSVRTVLVLNPGVRMVAYDTAHPKLYAADFTNPMKPVFHFGNITVSDTLPFRYALAANCNTLLLSNTNSNYVDTLKVDFKHTHTTTGTSAWVDLINTVSYNIARPILSRSTNGNAGQIFINKDLDEPFEIRLRVSRSDTSKLTAFNGTVLIGTAQPQVGVARDTAFLHKYGSFGMEIIDSIISNDSLYYRVNLSGFSPGDSLVLVQRMHIDSCEVSTNASRVYLNYGCDRDNLCFKADDGSYKVNLVPRIPEVVRFVSMDTDTFPTCFVNKRIKKSFYFVNTDSIRAVMDVRVFPGVWGGAVPTSVQIDSASVKLRVSDPSAVVTSYIQADDNLLFSTDSVLRPIKPRLSADQIFNYFHIDTLRALDTVFLEYEIFNVALDSVYFPNRVVHFDGSNPALNYIAHPCQPTVRRNFTDKDPLTIAQIQKNINRSLYSGQDKNCTNPSMYRETTERFEILTEGFSIGSGLSPGLNSGPEITLLLDTGLIVTNADSNIFIEHSSLNPALRWYPYSKVLNSQDRKDSAFANQSVFKFRFGDIPYDSKEHLFSNAAVYNNTIYEYLGGSRFNNSRKGVLSFELSSVCPAKQPFSRYRQTTAYISDYDCAAPQGVPLSTTECKVAVMCPGCVTPGTLLQDIQLFRTNVGPADNNGDRKIDLPVTPAQYAQTNRAAFGDTVQLNAYIGIYGGDFPNNIDANGMVKNMQDSSLFSLPYAYLDVKLDGGEMYEVINYEVIIIKNNLSDTVQVPGHWLPDTRITGGRIFFDLSLPFLASQGLDTTGMGTYIGDMIIRLTAQAVAVRNVEGFFDEPVVGKAFLSGTVNTYQSNLPDASLGNMNPNMIYWCENNLAYFATLGYRVSHKQAVSETSNCQKFYVRTLEVTNPDNDGEIIPDAFNREFRIYTLPSFGCMTPPPGYAFADSNLILGINNTSPPISMKGFWSGDSLCTTLDTVKNFVVSRINDENNIFSLRALLKPLCTAEPVEVGTSSFLEWGAVSFNAGQAFFTGVTDSLSVYDTATVFRITDATLSVPTSGGFPIETGARNQEWPFNITIQNDSLQEYQTAPNVYFKTVMQSIDSYRISSVRNVVNNSQYFANEQGYAVVGDINRANFNIKGSRQLRFSGNYTCTGDSLQSDTLLLIYGWICDTSGLDGTDNLDCNLRFEDTATFVIQPLSSGYTIGGLPATDTLNACDTARINVQFTPVARGRLYDWQLEWDWPAAMSIDCVQVKHTPHTGSPQSFTLSGIQQTPLPGGLIRYSATLPAHAVFTAGINNESTQSLNFSFRSLRQCGTLGNFQVRMGARTVSYCGDTLSQFQTGLLYLNPSVTAPKNLTLQGYADTLNGCSDTVALYVILANTGTDSTGNTGLIKLSLPGGIHADSTVFHVTEPGPGKADTLRLNVYNTNLDRCGTASTWDMDYVYLLPPAACSADTACADTLPLYSAQAPLVWHNCDVVCDECLSATSDAAVGQLRFPSGTTLTGGGDFEGTYLIEDTLILKTGTYRLLPGTKWLVEGGRLVSNVPTRGTVIVDSATLNLSGATITAACDSMWNRIILKNGASLITDSADGLRSRIEHSYVGVESRSLTNTLELRRTDFYNSLRTNVDMKEQFDGGKQAPGYIDYCRFYCEPEYMKAPYDYKSYSHRYYTYNHVYLSGVDYSDFPITHSVFDKGIRGVEVNWHYRQARIIVDSNRFSCWCNAVNKECAYCYSEGYGMSYVRGNYIDVRSEYILTVQHGNTRSNEGIYLMMDNVAVENNFIEGLSGGNPVNPYLKGREGHTSGITVRGRNVSITGNRVQNTVLGIRTGYWVPEGIQAATVSGNTLKDNIYQIVKYTSTPDQFSCNLIQKTPFMGNTHPVYGIFVDAGAVMADQGTPGNPAGNKFVGVDEPIVHENEFSFWTYQAANDEGVGVLASGTNGGNVFIIENSDSVGAVCGNTMPEGRVGAAENFTENNIDVVHDQSIKIFPNPFEDEFSIEIKEYSNYDNVSILLFNIHGKEIKTWQISEKNEYRTGRKLPAGMYILQININGVMSSHKIIKL